MDPHAPPPHAQADQNKKFHPVLTLICGLILATLQSLAQTPTGAVLTLTADSVTGWSVPATVNCTVTGPGQATFLTSIAGKMERGSPLFSTQVDPGATYYPCGTTSGFPLRSGGPPINRTSGSSFIAVRKTATGFVRVWVCASVGAWRISGTITSDWEYQLRYFSGDPDEDLPPSLVIGTVPNSGIFVGTPIPLAGYTIEVPMAGVPPVIEPVPDQVIDEEVPFTLTLKANHPGVPPGSLLFAKVTGPEGLRVTEAGALTWTPGEEAGPSGSDHVVQVSATADNQTVTTGFRITVREVNRPPVLTVPADQSFDELRTFFLRLGATDPDRPLQSLIFAKVTGPPGLNLLPTGDLQWTPTEAEGPASHPIEVSVTDGVDTVTFGFEITVLEDNQPPTLVNAPIPNADELSAWSF